MENNFEPQPDCWEQKQIESLRSESYNTKGSVQKTETNVKQTWNISTNRIFAMRLVFIFFHSILNAF